MLRDKDSLINHLEDKIEALMIENRKQSKSKSIIKEGRPASKEKFISLDVKVNSLGESLRR